MGVKISQKYSKEIEPINQILGKLLNEKYYEKSDNPSDGYLDTNIKELKSRFKDLLEKIDNGEESSSAKGRKLKKEIEERLSK